MKININKLNINLKNKLVYATDILILRIDVTLFLIKK